MRFPSDPDPPSQPQPEVRAKATAPKVAKKSRTPLGTAIAAVPDGTLRFLLGHPVGFDGALTRKEFLAWAGEHGRTNDTDWRFAWQTFVEFKSQQRVAAVTKPVMNMAGDAVPRRLVKAPNGGFVIVTNAAAPIAPSTPHPWSARLRPKLAAA